LYNELSLEVIDQISLVFPFNKDDLERGLKYLGYFLKLKDYLDLTGFGWLKRLKKGLVVGVLDGPPLEVGSSLSNRY
jgi:hypothetical protein